MTATCSYDTTENLLEPGNEKTRLIISYANNKGADQPAHPRSLISVFVVGCLGSIVPFDITEPGHLSILSDAKVVCTIPDFLVKT